MQPPVISSEDSVEQSSADWSPMLEKLLRVSWLAIAIGVPTLIAATQLIGFTQIAHSEKIAFWSRYLGALLFLFGCIYWLSLLAVLAFKHRGTLSASMWLKTALMLVAAIGTLFCLTHHRMGV